MPVLGTPSTAAAGIVNEGHVIPKGSLDAWKAARNASSSALCEVVAFGDSTTYGSGYVLATGSRSYLQQLRARAITDGYPDGGRGIAPAEDLAALAAPDSFIQTAGGTGWTVGNGVYPGQSWVSTTVSTITFRGKGRYCRLHWQDSAGTSTQFTYSIDGAAAVAVPAQSESQTWRNTVINLGTDGDHTVAVINSVPIGLTISAEFYRATGIVWHNQGTPGGKSGLWPANANYGGINQPAPTALGLSTINSPTSWRNPSMSTTGRKPALSMWAYGINDVTDINNTPSTAPTALLDVASSIGHWAAVCDSVGADKLVLAMHLLFNNNGGARYGSAYRAAVKEAAASVGAAFVDVTTILGPNRTAVARGYSGTDMEPHLLPAGYNAIGDYLWDNVLGPVALP